MDITGRIYRRSTNKTGGSGCASARRSGGTQALSRHGWNRARITGLADTRPVLPWPRPTQSISCKPLSTTRNRVFSPQQ